LVDRSSGKGRCVMQETKARSRYKLHGKPDPPMTGSQLYLRFFHTLKGARVWSLVGDIFLGMRSGRGHLARYQSSWDDPRTRRHDDHPTECFLWALKKETRNMGISHAHSFSGTFRTHLSCRVYWPSSTRCWCACQTTAKSHLRDTTARSFEGLSRVFRPP
jgi:hypothetical protein